MEKYSMGRCNTLDEYVDWNKLSHTNIERLKQLMKERELDGIIIDSMDSFKWLTAVPTKLCAWFYRHTHTAVLPGDADEPVVLGLFVPVLKSWFKDVREFPFESGEYLQPIRADRWPEICAGVVKDCGLSDGRIGLDPDTPYILKEALAEKLPNAKIVGAGEVLREGRKLKNEEEVKAIRVACSIGEMGMKAALDNIEEGKREREVAAEILRAFTYYGAEEILDMPLVISGTRPYFLRASEKIIRHGEVVRVDLGCNWGGYYSDFARTRYVGSRVPKDIKDAYHWLYEAYMAGIKMMRPGATNLDVFKKTNEVLYELSGGKYQSASPGPMGHALGVGVHEIPYFRAKAEEIKLEKGMYISFEPSFWTRAGQMMIEDDVLITETGVEFLTNLEREVEYLATE
jgi:Xaa-Pro dipeptidase